MRRRRSGGGWAAILYALHKAQRVGFLRMWSALRAKNTCKTCALGMGGQLGGMRNELGRFPEVCKKSVQAMAADLQGAIHKHFFDDFSLDQLRAFTSRELEAAGRLTQPLYAGPLDSHYRTINWDEAIDRIAKKLKKTDPHEAFFYSSGRSSNEAGFLLQLFARLWGTNNVCNCSYYCHQASGVGLTSVIGSGTATVTLDDLEKCNLVFLIGANPASNHPRFMRTLVDLKRRGGGVIVINPLKEVGLVRFKVPSDPRSLLFGSRIADLYIQPNIGGDVALLSGIAKAVIGRNAMNQEFLRDHAEGWDEVRRHIEGLTWDHIVNASGVDRRTIEWAAEMYINSNATIFCWAMGITHHAHGVANVQAIANLAILRGMLGSPGRGLLPLRGHSNVQGMGSMGVTPALKQKVFDRLQEQFNITLPTWGGMDTLSAMQRAHEGKIRFAFCLGGNLFGSNPDAKFASQAFGELDLVVHLNTTLNTGHAWGRGRETILLPVLARDEEPQPTTQESMFNYVRLSDGGPPHVAGPRSEVDIIGAIAHAVFDGTGPIDFSSMRSHAHLRRMIAAIIPGFEKIGEIDETKREFHIGERILHQPVFATKNGRAKMHIVDLPPSTPHQNGELRLLTMRSEGQFNTVVYEEEDMYRGQERRDVILMNESDIRRFALKIDQPVTVRNQTGKMQNMLVRAIDIPPGNCAMYYPEANVLIPMVADPQSRTPSFKNTMVRVEADGQHETSGIRDEKAGHVADHDALQRQRDQMKAC